MAGCSNCYSKINHAYNSIKILTNPVVLLPTLFMAVEKYGDLTRAKTASKSKALRTPGAIGLLGIAIAGAIDLCLTYKMSKDLKQQYTRTTYDLLVEAATKKGSDGGERINYTEECQVREMCYERMKELGYL